MPRHVIDVAHPQWGRLHVVAQPVSGFRNEPAHEILLFRRHPFSTEIERKRQVHMRDDSGHSPPASLRMVSSRRVSTPLGIGRGEVLIQLCLDQPIIIRQRRCRLATMFLVVGQQAIERHRHEAIRIVVHVRRVNARLLSVENAVRHSRSRRHILHWPAQRFVVRRAR